MEILLYAALTIGVLSEAVTELLVKSEIFRPVRHLASSLGGPLVSKLVSCGYCMSVWVAFGFTTIALFSPLSSLLLPGEPWSPLSVWFVVGLSGHRFSNVWHNVIDKWTDKYYDVRYVNTVKEGE